MSVVGVVLNPHGGEELRVKGIKLFNESGGQSLLAISADAARRAAVALFTVGVGSRKTQVGVLRTAAENIAVSCDGEEWTEALPPPCIPSVEAVLSHVFARQQESSGLSSDSLFTARSDSGTGSQPPRATSKSVSWRELAGSRGAAAAAARRREEEDDEEDGGHEELAGSDWKGAAAPWNRFAELWPGAHQVEELWTSAGTGVLPGAGRGAPLSAQAAAASPPWPSMPPSGGYGYGVGPGPLGYGLDGRTGRSGLATAGPWGLPTAALPSRGLPAYVHSQPPWFGGLGSAAREQARYEAMLAQVQRGGSGQRAAGLPAGGYAWSGPSLSGKGEAAYGAPASPFATPGSPAAAAAAAGAGQDLNQALQLMMLDALSRMRERDDDSGGSTAVNAGRALKKLHSLQERTRSKPREVIADYIAEVTRTMNVLQGDVWSLADYSSRVSWGRMRGLHRIHYHASHVLEHLLRGEADEGAAYLTQLIRAIHQVCLDNGSWATAMHMLPRSDPLEQVQFGGTQTELEVIAGYQEALKKLKRTGPKDEPERPGGKDESEKTGPKGGKAKGGKGGDGL